ncbi:MAG TPA: hypothetical protein VKB84_22785 [Candidatus Binataceae bacterium]|nr:hypothetical protein [Candidatus Binataceae bacterium]
MTHQERDLEREIKRCAGIFGHPSTVVERNQIRQAEIAQLDAEIKPAQSAARAQRPGPKRTARPVSQCDIRGLEPLRHKMSKASRVAALRDLPEAVHRLCFELTK